MNPSSTLPPARPRRRLRRFRRYAAVTALVLAVLLVGVYAAAQLYLPSLLDRKVDIEAWLTNTLQHPVKLGRVEIYWRGLNPGVRAFGVTVYSNDNQRASIRVGEVQVSVEPLALLRGRAEIYRLVLVRPSLTLAREGDGRIGVVDLALPTDAPSGAGLAWLLALPRVEIREGELRWQDARVANSALTVSNIELGLRNSGTRHRLSASADFPGELCRDCAVTADVTGDPTVGSWDGELLLRANGLDVQALPQALRERLPPDLRGRFDLDIWSDWRAGRPHIVRGQAAVTRLRFPFGAKPQTVSLRQVSAGVQWRQTDAGWRLDLDHLTLGLINAPWSAGRLRVENAGAESLFEIDHLDLDDLTRFVVTNQTQHPLLRYWVDVRPTGALDALRIKTQGPLAAPTGFEIAARLDRLGTATHEVWPSVSGLSGSVAFNQIAGKMEIDSRDFAFYLPRVFRGPLAAVRASGKVQWRKTDDAWHIDGAALQAQGSDGKGSGTLSLEIPHNQLRSPTLTLRVDFRDGNGANAERYYPVYDLPPKVLRWMESSIVDGRVTSGYLVYDGPIREFPFEQRQGKFELHAQVRDGVYRYLPGWTPLTQAQVTVAVNGADVLVTGSGRIGTLQAHDVRVEFGRQPNAETRLVRVRGQVDGPVAETLRVLQSVETKKDYAWHTAVREIATAAGTGALDIDVLVPLTPKVDDSFFATYRVQDAALKLADGSGVDTMNGVARFTDAGLHDSSLQGNLFGGPATVVSAYDSDGLRLRANGTLKPAELLRRRPAIAERVRGTVDWSLDWRDGPNGVNLRGDAKLGALRMRLPPPFNQTGPDRIAIATDVGRPDALVLAISAGATASGKLAFDRVGSRWQFNRGRMHIGQPAASLPPREGLEIGLNVDAVDVDQWLPLFDTAGDSESLALVSGVRAEIKQLGLLNRDWGRSFVNLARHGEEWRMVVDGDAAAGEGSLLARAGNRARLRFDLAYLRLPAPRDSDAKDDRTVDPRSLPAVELRARAFEYKRRSFGELDFAAAPDAQGWRIDRLNLTRPELRIAVDGVWRRRGTRDGSEFNISWNSDDMGAALDALGLPDQMVKGKVSMQAQLAWPGAPSDPELAGMNGNIEVTAENGRFLKLDPGAARLFGLLDLRSIGRYLTLDFSPAFGKGFAFDAIHGKIVVDRGNARTKDLVVSGPSLSLGVAGRVGLATEDYDLAIVTSPRIGSTLTLTSWGLFGPQVAAAVLAFQSLFKRQIQEGARTTYLVKGPWENPRVTKLEKPVAAQPAPAEPAQ